MGSDGNVLNQMIAIIQARPTITVRELAQELGYAEERSVYYWLKKSGHKGLKDFKDAILNEASGPEVEGASPTRVKEETADDVMVISSYEYAPWLLPGDELNIDRHREPVDGELVMVRFQRQEGVRRYILGSPVILVHPARPTETIRIDKKKLHDPKGAIRIVGPITRVIRRRP